MSASRLTSSISEITEIGVESTEVLEVSTCASSEIEENAVFKLFFGTCKRNEANEEPKSKIEG
jgi:hypothetical protein